MKQNVAQQPIGEEETTSSRTVCGICSGGCGITLTLKNGRVATIEGDLDHPVSRGHLCPKGRALPEILKAPDRLTHPLRKTALGEWERLSWDDAYNLIARKLGEIRKEYGPEAMAVHVGQAGVGKEFLPYVERFCNLYGTPNFSTSGSHCAESKWMANTITFGAMPIADFENSDCIVLWGKNPRSSTPSVVREITEARRRGCALIVIDPRRTRLAEEADLHLQPRPGTDGALALGLLHFIIENTLYNREFVGEWTKGFTDLIAHVREFTPERVEEITWVPASLIRQAARLYGTSGSSCISQGVALELSTNGFQALRAIAVLQAITGNLDIPGGAIFLEEARLTDLRVVSRSDRKPAIGAEEYPLFHSSSGHAQANLYARAILEGKPYPLAGLIVAASNPVLTWPNAEKVRRALGRLKFLVVMDPFMTETAGLADLVLPSATFLGGSELWDSSHLSSAPRLGLSPRLRKEEGLPTNWEVWKEIAARMGYIDSFPWETEEEAIGARIGALGITVQDLKDEPGGHVYHRWSGKKYEKKGFNTPSGKVEITSAYLGHYGHDPMPTYREPAESPLSTPMVAARYPLVATTGARTLGYLHSRFRNVPSLRKRTPEPHVEINPETAAGLGIEDEEMVIVETARGSIEIKAKLTDRMLPRVISLPHGWDEANANVLTDDIDLDPVTGFPADRALLAGVKKKAQLQRRRR
jgi:anaerobic selenocysteine-containing dehydrogenase